MELNLIHNELLAELAWPTDKFPADVTAKLQAIDQMEAEYNAAPTPEGKIKIEKASGKLWHQIKDLEEADRPAYEEQVVSTDPPQNDGTVTDPGHRSIIRRHRRS